MQGFSNLSITAPRKRKPHIYKREGWWRVSPFQGPRWSRAWEYAHAHSFINVKNARMHHGTGTD